MPSFEEEIEFSRMNHTGAPLDIIRASTCSLVTSSVESGKTLDEAIKLVSHYNECVKPDLMVKWSISERDIDFATEHGIKLARIGLRL